MTAERPPAKIDGKPNPAYQAWYREQKKAKKPRTFRFDKIVDGEDFAANFGGLYSDDGDEAFVEISNPTPEMDEWMRELENSFPIRGISGLKVQEPEVLTLRVVKLVKNNRFVSCADPVNRGKAVGVRLLRAGAGPKLVKKSIRVELRDGKYFQIR